MKPSKPGEWVLFFAILFDGQYVACAQKKVAVA